MSRPFIFYSITVCLLLAGAWGLKHLIGNATFADYKLNIQNESAAPATQKLPQNQALPPFEYATHHDILLQEELTKIQGMLKSRNFSNAAAYVNDRYSGLSSDSLERIRHLFQTEGFLLERQEDKPEALRLYTAAALVFSDLQIWLNISRTSIELKRWRTAFDATLQASLLQNDDTELNKLHIDLVKIAAHYRADLEHEGDTLGAHTIYDQLYKAHSGYPRFQLELAYSYIRLNRITEARPLLEQLQYDLDFGDISREILAKLNAATEPVENIANTSNTQGFSNNIEVPLTRLGTNLLAKVQINKQEVPLLLDTGASITALDNQLVNRLNLTDTGQRIQINTANGLTEAALYHAKSIQLGRFSLRNQIVAGIEMSNTSPFKGLLGTDLLNSVNHKYAYVIDNRKSALVFVPK